MLCVEHTPDLKMMRTDIAAHIKILDSIPNPLVKGSEPFKFQHNLLKFFC
jgi:hypothetical protein